MTVATVAAGDDRIELLVLGVPETTMADPIHPMDRLAWAVMAEQAHLLRGGQPGSAAAPVFLVGFGGGLRPSLIAAVNQDGVRTHEEVVVDFEWPWLDEQVEEAVPLEQSIALELGRRLMPSTP